MGQINLKLSFLISLVVFSGCNKLESDRDQRSYAIGFTLGKQLSEVKTELDLDIVARGLKDGVENSAKLEPSVVSQRLSELQRKQGEFEALKAADNLKKSQEFIAKAAADPTLKALEPGLLVKEAKAAPAGSPKRTAALREEDEILVRYRAKLADGTVVDQTSDPQGFRLKFKNLVVPGLKKVVQRMPIGAEWTIYLSPEHGFGPSARPGIPSQSALVYDLTLVSIQSKAQTGAPSGAQTGASSPQVPAQAPSKVQ